jgi:uncharacterized Fe-S cluster-containing MiaB family protein
MEVLQRQWERAMLDEDWEAIDRIDAAREKIEALPVRGCVWAGTETCRMCAKADSCTLAEGAA